MTDDVDRLPVGARRLRFPLVVLTTPMTAASVDGAEVVGSPSMERTLRGSRLEPRAMWCARSGSTPPRAASQHATGADCRCDACAAMPARSSNVSMLVDGGREIPSACREPPTPLGHFGGDISHHPGSRRCRSVVLVAARRTVGSPGWRAIDHLMWVVPDSTAGSTSSTRPASGRRSAARIRARHRGTRPRSRTSVYLEVLGPDPALPSRWARRDLGRVAVAATRGGPCAPTTSSGVRCAGGRGLADTADGDETLTPDGSRSSGTSPMLPGRLFADDWPFVIDWGCVPASLRRRRRVHGRCAHRDRSRSRRPAPRAATSRR